MLWRLLNRLRGYERLKGRGDRLFLAGEFERAFREYSRARSILSGSDHRAFALDALLRSCERQSSAISEEKLEDLVPPGLEDLFELAIGDKPASRAEAYRILGPDFRAGYVALVQGKANRAAHQLRKAAAAAPSSFVVHLELGRALSLASRLEEARDALEIAERLAPTDDEGRLLSAAVHLELGRFQEARSRLLPLLDHGEAGPEVLYLMGKALSGLKHVDEALEKFRETVKIEPHFHEAFFEGGRLLKERGDVEGAFQLMSRASALAPDDVHYNRELASLVLSHALDERVGLAACDRLMVADDENRWQYLHWIAELYIRRGWKREARDPLEKALALVPEERRRERHAIEEMLSSLSGR
ncbi:MAG: tetratricopeptide repeat protein [Vicinamibacteria bacterium]